MGMNVTQLKEWAKEEIRDAILDFWKDKTNDVNMTVDEYDALKKQANRALSVLTDRANTIL
jgi:hypothetical protein